MNRKNQMTKRNMNIIRHNDEIRKKYKKMEAK